jgi:hypothetical protein
MKTSPKTKKIIGLIFFLLGAALIAFSALITADVQEGEQKIEKSQQTVDTVKQVSRIHPLVKKIAEIATAPVQSKIDQGTEEANKYRGISLILAIFGLSSAFFGLIFLIWGFFQKKKN